MSRSDNFETARGGTPSKEENITWDVIERNGKKSLQCCPNISDTLTKSFSDEKLNIDASATSKMQTFVKYIIENFEERPGQLDMKARKKIFDVLINIHGAVEREGMYNLIGFTVSPGFSVDVSAHSDEGMARLNEDIANGLISNQLEKVLSTKEVDTVIGMASKSLSAESDILKGQHGQAASDLTHDVKVMTLKDGASTEEYNIKTRKVRQDLDCEKHRKVIESYCKTHDVACCRSCAMIDHNKLSCERLSIDHALVNIRGRLIGLKEKGVQKLRSYPDYTSKISQWRKYTDNHLQTLTQEVNQVVDEAIKTDKAKADDDAAKINKEIDEKNEILHLNDQIQKNNAEREKKLELNQTNAEKRRKRIDKKQRILLAEIQNIAEMTEGKIGEFEKSWQDNVKSTENAIQTLDAVLEDDQIVVKDGQRVIMSVGDGLSCDRPMDKDGVEQIVRAVSGLRFVKGIGSEKYNGHIDGKELEWRLIDTISVKHEITNPVMLGCIDECHVIIRDVEIYDTYVLNISTKHIQKVIPHNSPSVVITCARLHDGNIVCGKGREDWTGDSLTGCIGVYDKHWQLINEFTIPRNTTTNNTTFVHIRVDQDGMILAAEAFQSKVYVINPANGEILNTIECKQDIVLCGSLSSGHIIAIPSEAHKRVFIIDRDGNQREITHSTYLIYALIDPNMTDDLYLITTDSLYMCAIDQVMSGGVMMERRVATFKCDLSGYTQMYYQVMMTSSGNLLAYDGDNILVFKRTLSF